MNDTAHSAGKSLTKGLRTWIEIDESAVIANADLVRSKIPAHCSIMAVIKSNAYGHGLFNFARLVLDPRVGATSLGVDSVVEALALRREGITAPILVLGYTLPERMAEALDGNIALTISSFEALRAAMSIGTSERPLTIHIEIDSGLHRQGFLPHQIVQLVEEMRAAGDKPKIKLEGLYTHFADAKRAEGEAYTHEQVRIFKEVAAQFKAAGFSPKTHISASPAVLRYGAFDADMVRVGALLYGIWPSEAIRSDLVSQVTLRPALSWKTIVSEVKQLKAGDTIGYDRSYTLPTDTIAAVCPIGYWHGYPGSLSSKGNVLINGVVCQVIGKITMDMIVVDCGAAAARGNVRVGDEVMLISAEIDSPVSAREVALKAGVSVHELLTRLNSRIEHIHHVAPTV